MKINRHNYEAFLLDRIEGRLSDEDLILLEAFLEADPQLKEAAEMAELMEGEAFPCLEPGTVRFPLSEKIKFDHLSFARLEGELSKEELELHEKAMAEDVGLEKEWALWQHARLDAAPVIFEAKHKLRRSISHNNRRLIIAVISTAASIALFFAIINLRTGSPEQVPLMGDARPAPAPAPVGEEIPAPETQIPGEGDEGLENEELPELEQGKEAGPPPGQLATPVQGLQRTYAATLPAQTGDKMSEPAVKELLKPSALRKALNDINSPAPEGPRRDHIASLGLPPVTPATATGTLAQLRERGLKDVDLFNLAESGVSSLSRLSGSEMQLSASRDEDGSVTGYTFSSRLLNISRKINKP